MATNSPTTYAATNLPAGLSLNTSTGLISGTPTAGGGLITLTATNASGSGSATLQLTVQAQSQTNGLVLLNDGPDTGRSDQAFSFQVIATGIDSAATFSATGLPAGLTIDPATGLISGTVAQGGSYSVTITINDAGKSAHFSLELILTADPAYPVITSPGSAKLVPGGAFQYAIAAPVSGLGSNDPTLFSISGKLPAGLTFDPATGKISGTYAPAAKNELANNSADVSSRAMLGSVQLVAHNSHGTATKTLVFLQAVPQLLNISTRLNVLTDDNVLIGGFIVTGNAPKQVLIRGLGPSLTALKVQGALADPILDLHKPDGSVVSNDNWKQTQEAAIRATGIAPTNDLESAILATLDPGAYTAVVRGKNRGTGVGLVEAYDLDTAADSDLGNISTRGFVNTGGNVLIGGLIVGGGSEKVLIRAVGPSLQAAGVADPLLDPTLELRNAQGALMTSNDNWQDTQAAAITATGIAPKDPRESAILATLPASNYTAIVRGKNNTTGVGLVEVYELH